MATRERFTAMLAVLCETFGRQATTPLADGYWMALGALTDAELATATTRALSECRFMPAPAELLDLAGKKPESIEAKAIEAWTVVRRTVDTHDYTASVDFGTLVNAIVANLGGWQWLCDLKLPDLDIWARKEFLRIYAELAHVDPSKLHGAAHRGFLNGPISVIPIGGETPMKRLPLPDEPVAPLIRAMADAATFEPPRPATPPPPPPPPPRRPPPARPSEAQARDAIEALRERVERSQRENTQPEGHAAE